MKKGLFITFEGIDGSGKTTQLKLTDKFLKSHGYDTLILREPGSTPLSEQVRKILLNKKLTINALSELMLYVAARADLVDKIIRPALHDGKIVLCDRFHDSTTAYQGYGRKLDLRLIRQLHKLSVGETQPDLTLIIDVDYKTSLTRRKKSPDRLERETKAFFKRVRDGFRDLARKNKSRIKVIDGTPPANEVFEEVIQCLTKKLKI